jgi:hypothetical protein
MAFPQHASPVPAIIRELASEAENRKHFLAAYPQKGRFPGRNLPSLNHVVEGIRLLD